MNPPQTRTEIVDATGRLVLPHELPFGQPVTVTLTTVQAVTGDESSNFFPVFVVRHHIAL